MSAMGDAPTWMTPALDGAVRATVGTLDVVNTLVHVQRTLVRAGQKVAAGDVLATVGSTGRSTGSQVHFAATRAGQAVDQAAVLKSTASSRQDLRIAAADAEEG